MQGQWATYGSMLNCVGVMRLLRRQPRQECDRCKGGSGQDISKIWIHHISFSMQWQHEADVLTLSTQKDGDQVSTHGNFFWVNALTKAICPGWRLSSGSQRVGGHSQLLRTEGSDA